MSTRTRGAATVILSMTMLAAVILGITTTTAAADQRNPDCLLCHEATQEFAAAAVDKDTACPACHTEVNPGARFCPHCGDSLVAGDRCENCEAPLSPDAKFCARCGEPAGATERSCPNCQAKLTAGARFCMECGERVIE